MTMEDKMKDLRVCCHPQFSTATGKSSTKEMQIITPATPASIYDTTRSVRTCSLSITTATTPKGSARPDSVDKVIAITGLRVAKYTGKATQTPSNILCAAIAIASGSPKWMPW